jgi:hypothetical protein
VAREYGVSQGWISRLVARYRLEGGVSHCLCKWLGLNGGGRLAITGQENFVVTI